MNRCDWCSGDPIYQRYHDEEWGRAVHDDVRLFEMLVLEGAQAGLSWITILKKRDRYREVFQGFHPVKVARMTDKQLEKLLEDPGIVRNRLKVFGARKNAVAFLKVREEFGSFDAYVWGFVGSKPIVNRWKTVRDIPVTTPESDAMAKDLKKRGFTFVGSTICYAYMQATGMVNDHHEGCDLYPS